MEADFSVELGPDDDTLEFPWSDPDGKLRYYDLKRQQELLLNVEESIQFPDLGEFLAAVNSPTGQLESVKCDGWFTEDLQAEDEIFGATGKFGSYVDLIFSDDRRYSFPEHEKFAQQLTKLLKRVPEIPALAEFIIRRCYFHPDAEGFYFTFYLFGYGDDEDQCRGSWAIALKLVENALRQVSAA
ncbi:MAG TPA: hypothetical protein VH088_01235 [Terriglobales bacterium]|jgi:hypothetical protein|nr:hypothetical protein [Terriglobales bacterium]